MGTSELRGSMLTIRLIIVRNSPWSVERNANLAVGDCLVLGPIQIDNIGMC